MLNITENLKNNQILYHQNILELRTLIRQRYPYSSSDYRAKLFASAVHKLLDRYLTGFDQTIQIQIKNSLLKEAVKKGHFNLTAYQLFEVSTSLYHSEEILAENLTAWLNHPEDVIFSAEEIADYITHFRYKDDGSARLLSTTSIPVQNPVLLPSISLGKLSLIEFLRTASFKYAAAFFTVVILVSWVFFQGSLSQNYLVQPLLTDEVMTPVITKQVPSLVQSPDTNKLPELENHLSPSLQYKEINQDALAAWLNERNSMLSDKSYLTP
ncbi:MAG: hypothetical protein K0S30_1522, partial [Clostridia bacterium]|nr:hypothetical protein [Clostridia bacterium]